MASDAAERKRPALDQQGTPTAAAAQLERWQQFGGVWRVVSRSAQGVSVSMCRCDDGEEVELLTSADPELLAWLSGRTSSDDDR